MEQQNAGAPAARPTFLTVLCILSFIASGFAIIWSIIVLLGAIAAQALVSGTDTMIEGMDAETADSVTTATNAVESVGMGLVWAYVIVTILATIISLMGVIKMWKLKKAGFYLYVGASLASMIMASVYEFSIGALIVPIAFIVMYGLNLKHMK